MTADAMARPPVGSKRPGGRAARVRSTVLAATIAILEESGYDDVTFEHVAERAGVHRTTVYRRWPTIAELVSDAYRDHSDAQVPLPDTGTLAGDLRAIADGLAVDLSSPAGGRRARSVVAAAAASDDLANALHRFVQGRLRHFSPVINRSVERGEVSATVDAERIVEAVFSAVWFRFLFIGRPLDDDFLEQAVAVAVDGLG